MPPRGAGLRWWENLRMLSGVYLIVVYWTGEMDMRVNIEKKDKCRDQ